MPRRTMINPIILLICFATSIRCQTPKSKPCLPENRRDGIIPCLRRISDTLYNETAFFFGRSLDAICDNTAQNNPDNLNCFTNDEGKRRYSLAARVFPNGLRPESIDRYLEVSFSTMAGRYNACDASYQFEQRTTDVNPDMTPTSPIYVRNTPTFKIEGHRGAYYTIVVVDAAYGMIHGVFKDYPDVQDVIPYKKPLNYFNVTNVFVFVAYRQPDKDYMLEPRWLPILDKPELVKNFSVSHFATDHGLIGPLAVNWMLVKRDAWTVQQVFDRSHDPLDNYCISLQQDELRTSQLLMAQQFPTLDTYLDLAFYPSPLDYTACCQLYTFSTLQIDIKPTAKPKVPAAALREAPTVSLERSSFRASTNGRMLTLLAVDVDVRDPGKGSSNKPFLVWLVSNLEEDNLQNGLLQADLPYLEPLPVDQPHRLIFFLYEQDPFSRSTANASQFTDNSACSKDHNRRCLFDLMQFVVSNKLTLRAFNWLTVQPDMYTMAARIREGASEDEVCRSVPDYKNCEDAEGSSTANLSTTTPSSAPTFQTISISAVFIGMTLLMFWV